MIKFGYMEFYESWREENQTVSCHADCNHFYPPHYHSNAEIYVCVSGAQKVTVNGVGYEVKSGEAVIIDNYAIHSYDLSRINDEDYVIIVPPNLLGEFKRLKGGLKIANPIIKDEKLVAEFAHICKYALLPVFSDETAFAAINYIFALAFTELGLTDEKYANDETLMRKILQFVDDNFKEKLSLGLIAKELGYSREYVSRVFHRYMKRGLNDYINERRLDYISRADKTRKKTELALESGFSSMQTYYRALNKYNIKSRQML